MKVEKMIEKTHEKNDRKNMNEIDGKILRYILLFVILVIGTQWIFTAIVPCSAFNDNGCSSEWIRR